jgi:hypothetical protein
MQIGEFPIPSWLNIKKEIAILGIFFQENLKSAASKSWNDTINKARGFLFIHMGRDLNIIQRVIFYNIFGLNKIWYMAAIYPTTNQLIVNHQQS